MKTILIIYICLCTYSVYYMKYKVKNQPRVLFHSTKSITVIKKTAVKIVLFIKNKFIQKSKF